MCQRHNATEYTVKANTAFLKENFLDITDRQDFEDAQKGFIARLDEPEIYDERGEAVFSDRTYAFLDEERPAPETVNPSLWRQARLNRYRGLFKVRDRVYQVRGYDISNITFIEGDTGYIVVDPLTSAELARASTELVYKHLGKKPVTAVIYTHSHLDHWGGVAGVISAQEAAERDVPVIAPENFMKEAVSENILAGNAMGRRGEYMFGMFLPHDEKANVDGGLGKSMPLGVKTLIAPTLSIREPVETHAYDGVEIVFQLTPETEAPVEMTLFFPGLRAFCPAELCTQTMHNIYTIRGAQTRDAKGWAGYIDDAIELFGGRFDTVFSTHHWPVWGSENGIAYLKKQRDIYKYIHDQTLRLANHGYTMPEIAERLRLPESLAKVWHIRGTYGTLSHNSKAVYNRYLGYYDGNPATLNELPPSQAGKKYVEYMGGAAAVLEKARADFDKGEYRWAAQVLRHLLFADPDNKEARLLQADVFEQLGYQAEGAPWRNAYLTGAMELREGVGRPVTGRLADMSEMTFALRVRDLFDFLAVRLNGPKAEGRKITINFIFPDSGEKYELILEDSVLNHHAGKQSAHADTTLTISKENLIRAASGLTDFETLIRSGKAKIEGEPSKLKELFSLLDTFEPKFNIVLP